jgi:hypothetical protein
MKLLYKVMHEHRGLRGGQELAVALRGDVLVARITALDKMDDLARTWDDVRVVVVHVVFVLSAELWGWRCALGCRACR